MFSNRQIGEIVCILRFLKSLTHRRRWVRCVQKIMAGREVRIRRSKTADIYCWRIGNGSLKLFVGMVSQLFASADFH